MPLICPTCQVAFEAPCRPPATLHGVVFDILGARTFEGDFSNVTRSYAGKGTVRYAATRLPDISRVCYDGRVNERRYRTCRSAKPPPSSLRKATWGLCVLISGFLGGVFAQTVGGSMIGHAAGDAMQATQVFLDPARYVAVDVCELQCPALGIVRRTGQGSRHQGRSAVQNFAHGIAEQHRLRRQFRG